MLKRLFMTILIACLAAPAAATSHGGTMPSHGAAIAAEACHGGGQPVPHRVPAQLERHECIGCAPVPQAVAQVGEPNELRGTVAVPHVALPLEGTGQAPDTPPPRA